MIGESIIPAERETHWQAIDETVHRAQKGKRKDVASEWNEEEEEEEKKKKKKRSLVASCSKSIPSLTRDRWPRINGGRVE